MFDSETPMTILQRMVSDLDTGLISNEGSFIRDVLAPSALELYRAYMGMRAMEPMFYIDESSGPYIDKAAAVFGLTRKAGSRATCAITMTGTAGVVVPAGTAFVTEDGLAFSLDADATMTGSEVTGSLTAAASGVRYNVAAGEITRPRSRVAGLSGFSNGSASGGTDDESDRAFVARFYAYLQSPATSGNGYFYQTLALEVSGVGAARVVALWDGPGTVAVILADEDLQPADAQAVTDATAYVAAGAPIGAEVTVRAASACEIHVAATLTLAPGADAVTVQAEIETAIADYLRELAAGAFPAVLNADLDDLSQSGITVSYNQIAALILGCEGVRDYTALMLNGGTVSVVTDYDAVPVLEEVTLTWS
ncbi:MAG: baseplate J/gp47 family protein [Oscillospiraceae bacterium]|nr:baseplate J/gp47 family protein [Oscillospiraceae bacterium]